MDTRRLSVGEIVAAASGVALILFMSAVNWFTVVNDPTPTGRRNAWEAFGAVDFGLFLLALVPIGLAIANSAGVDLRDLPLHPRLIVAAAGLAACGLIVFRLTSIPDLQIDYGGAPPVSVKERGGVVEREVGIYLGLGAAAGMVLGALLYKRRLPSQALLRR